MRIGVVNDAVDVLIEGALARDLCAVVVRVILDQRHGQGNVTVRLGGS
jgi:hypothetical protein